MNHQFVEKVLGFRINPTQKRIMEEMQEQFRKTGVIYYSPRPMGRNSARRIWLARMARVGQVALKRRIGPKRFGLQNLYGHSGKIKIIVDEYGGMHE